MTILKAYYLQVITDQQKQLDEAAVIIRKDAELFDQAAKDMEERGRRIAELERLGNAVLDSTATWGTYDVDIAWKAFTALATALGREEHHAPTS